MKRFSLYLPDEMYEDIRLEAFNRRVSMNDLIVNNLLLKKTYIDSKLPPPTKPLASEFHPVPK